jgi:hypothetical protein
MIQTLEGSRGHRAEADHEGLAPPVGRPAPRAHCQPQHRNVDSLPPPRLHLYRPLSQFDPTAHDGGSSPYIPVPATPLRHKSFKKTEILIILRAPPYSRA